MTMPEHQYFKFKWKSHTFVILPNVFKPVMGRRKLLDDVVDFDESFFVGCCRNSILRRVELERHVNREGECINV